jgi:calpain-15
MSQEEEKKQDKKQESPWIAKQVGTALIKKTIFKEIAKDGTLDALFARCLSLGGVQFEDASFPPSRLSLIQDWSDDKCAQE